MEENTEIQEPRQKQLSIETQTLKATEAGWLKGLKDRFNRVFLKEQVQGEHFPKIAVDIFFSAHRAPALEGRFEKMFKEADIYIPEAVFWDPITLGWIRSIADGKRKPNANGTIKVAFADFVAKQQEIVYDSHKPITVIDVPYSHPLARKIERFTPPLTGNFSDSLDSVRGKLKKDADDHLEREKYMLSQFKPKIQELLEEYPLLKQKKELKVLLSLGSFHTSIFHSFKKSMQLVTREFDSMPHIFGFFDEAERRAMFGKEIDRELAAKVFLEMLFFDEISPLFDGITNDNIEREGNIARKIFSQFSIEEAEEIFNKLKQGGDKKQLFQAELEKKGIKLPASEKDMNEFLAKPLTRPNTMQE